MGGMVNIPDDTIAGGNGASGKIVKLSLPTFVVADDDGIEKIVVIGKDTLIRRLHDTITPADIKIDDFAIVLGTPNEKGQIAAKLIRLVPAPIETETATTTGTHIN